MTRRPLYCVADAHFRRWVESLPAPAFPGSTLAEIERYAILKGIVAADGSTNTVARTLDISVRKVQYKLIEYLDDYYQAPRLPVLRAEPDLGTAAGMLALQASSGTG
jgi:hypothetical protein